MQLMILAAAALLVPSGALHHAVGPMSYTAAINLGEPASLALLGAAVLGLSKLLRKKLGS